MLAVLLMHCVTIAAAISSSAALPRHASLTSGIVRAPSRSRLAIPLMREKQPLTAAARGVDTILVRAKLPPHNTARRSALGLGLAAMVPTLRAAADDQAVADDQAAADDQALPLPAEKWVPATPMEAFMGPPQPKKVAAPPKKIAPIYPWDGAKGALPPIAGVNAPAKGTFSDATKALGLPSFSSYKPPAYESRGTNVRSTSVKPETAPAGVALPELSGDLTTVLGSVAVVAAAVAPFFLGGAAGADREPRVDTEGTAPTAAPSAPVQLDALPSWLSRKPRPTAQPPAPPAPPTAPPGEEGR